MYSHLSEVITLEYTGINKEKISNIPNGENNLQDLLLI